MHAAEGNRVKHSLLGLCACLLGSYLLLLRLLLWFIRWAEPLRFSSDGNAIVPADLPSRPRATQLQHSSDQRMSELSHFTNRGRHHLIARSWRSLLCEVFCPAVTTLAGHDDNCVSEQTLSALVSVCRSQANIIDSVKMASEHGLLV